MAFPRSYRSKAKQRARDKSLESNMGRWLAEQSLVRIGYVSGIEQQTPEPDPHTRPNIKPATMAGVQTKIPSQLKEQYATRQQAPTTIPTRFVSKSRRHRRREKAPSPSILPNTSSMDFTLGAEASYHILASKDGPSVSLPPPPLIKAEILTGLHSELERRQNICLGIERQLEVCDQELQSLPPKLEKITKEHEKRIAGFEKPVHDEKQKLGDVKRQDELQTVQEAQIKEMRDIYLQYDHGSIRVPDAESVHALFVIIGNTENQVKKAEEANKVAKRREEKLEEKLYRARCAVFEMEDEIEEMENGEMENGEVENREMGIEEVKNGEMGKEAKEPNAEKRMESKRKPRRRKGTQGGQQGKGEGGDVRVGRRRNRRRNTFSKAGKMGSNAALLIDI